MVRHPPLAQPPHSQCHTNLVIPWSPANIQSSSEKTRQIFRHPRAKRRTTVVAVAFAPLHNKTLAIHTRLQVSLYLHLPRMRRPVRRSPAEHRVLRIHPGTALNQKPNHLLMPSQSRLVQRRRMSMPSQRIVAIRIFSQIQQRTHNLRMTKLRSHRKRQPPIIRRRCLEQKTKRINPIKRSRYHHIHPCPMVDQRQHRIVFIKDRSWPNRFVRIRSMLAKQRNQLALHTAFASHATRSNQHQRLIARRLLCSRLQ